MTLAIHLFPKPADPPMPVALFLGGLAGLWGIYGLIFLATGNATLGQAGVDAAANVLPLAALAIATRAVLMRVFARTPSAQVASHAVLAIVFALAWYVATVLLLALFGWLAGRSFLIRGFTGPALTWQAFQGLILYSAVAAACYALRAPVAPAQTVREIAADAALPLERYLIREGEDFRPVDVSDIISIAGAQDYSEVSTPSGHHLVRMSLGEFETRLDPRRFIRVHRSVIIQLAFLERAEPAGGGRMLAHMTNGQSVPISRSGVKALRPLIV
jgi:two-component system LytT family response regulator